MGETIQLQTQDGHTLSAYVSKPEGGIRGGLVVVQEIFGVNQHIRRVADSYAREGYLAIAPALFDRVEPHVELTYEEPDRKRAFALYGQLDQRTALLDIAAAFQFVEGEGAGAGVIGFCFGGLMAFLAATRGPQVGMKPKCTVGYYAGGIGAVANEDPSCPVMLHFGGADTHIGMDQVDAVRDAHPEMQVFVYENAGHAFNRDADANSFVPDAASLAKHRTLAFLAENLA